jgi:hypothetical protein
MSDEATREGQVRSTPEGGPLDAGAPAPEPGAGQVRLTPEAGPLPEGETVQPPTWREQMRGPIPGLDEAASATAARTGAPSDATGAERAAPSAAADAKRGDQGRKGPAYIGKPVSEVPWGEALKLARPILSVLEKVLIVAIDLAGQGLTSLARYLEQQRQKRG